MGWTNAGRRKAASHRKGHKLSAATRKKISNALRGKKHPHKGHPESPATRAKISRALKGKKHPHKGHPESAATRAKISAALRGRHRAHHKAHKASMHHRGNVSLRTHGAGGLTNAQVLHLTRYKLLNSTILDIKEHRNIHGNRTKTNRLVILRNEHRRRRRA